MKYYATIVDPWLTAAVIASPPVENGDLALRHAKALLAVVEAAKKTERLRRTSKAGAKAERAWWNACNAESVAVAALERVEKEVRRVHRELEKQHG